MPTAKETLKIGFTVVANEGNYVTKEAVKTYGWSKLVDDGPDVGGTSADEAPNSTVTAKKATKAAQ